jgi:hypothetical protein
MLGSDNLRTHVERLTVRMAGCVRMAHIPAADIGRRWGVDRPGGSVYSPARRAERARGQGEAPAG